MKDNMPETIQPIAYDVSQAVPANHFKVLQISDYFLDQDLNAYLVGWKWVQLFFAMGHDRTISVCAGYNGYTMTMEAFL